MPNWVMNRLRIEGKDAAAVMRAICTPGEEEGEKKECIDFNKILPMPKELNIVSGTVTERSVEIYLTSINPEVDYFGELESKFTLPEFEKLMQKLQKNRGSIIFGSCPNANLSREALDKLIEQMKDYKEYSELGIIGYGKRAVDNVLQYGHMTWYDWRNANWNTKWNACDNWVTETEAIFNTAWDHVAGLIELLSEQHPENTFYYDFAEEQTGYYAGSLTFHNGDVIDGEVFDQYSKKAFELYFELWGEDENFVFIEELNNYKYIDPDADEETH